MLQLQKVVVVVVVAGEVMVSRRSSSSSIRQRKERKSKGEKDWNVRLVTKKSQMDETTRLTWTFFKGCQEFH